MSDFSGVSPANLDLPQLSPVDPLVALLVYQQKGSAVAGSKRFRNLWYHKETPVTAEGLANGRVEFQVCKLPGALLCVRGAFELKRGLGSQFRKTILQVFKELVAVFVRNVVIGNPQERVYIFLTDGNDALLYCLAVSNYSTWKPEQGLNQIIGRITHSM
ncbi:hypothetical protein WJX72_002618 [[Myrmecia] bisecta]|uniref:Uncharacterized protein n=1 Tax=[Myrmecia] bisecta TaxID=41462 RepID=A0AAW1QEG4_9CHLO